MELNELVKICHENAKEHGFWEDKLPINDAVFKEKLLLLHSEISEVFEELRNNHGVDELYYSEKDNIPKPEGIPIELADLAIRLFDLFGALELDLEATILEKHNYNKTRPYKHGKTC